MKWLLRVFALLDLICFALVFDQAKTQFLSLLSDDYLTGIEFVSRILFVVLTLSLLVSAGFLLFNKKVGIIIYYFQLPLRLPFLVFSAGFITLLSYVSASPNLQNILLPIIIFAEMLRIYYSYKIQKEVVGNFNI